MNAGKSRTYHRRSIRLKDYDYSQSGAYFVTIVTYERMPLFGEVVDGTASLNQLGEIAILCWESLPMHFSNIRTDAFVVMPNHVHGIVVFLDSPERRADVGARHAVPVQRNDPSPRRAFGKPTKNSLPTLVGSFKAAVTKQVNELRRTPGMPVWQRNYYEHVVRGEDELERIRQYIRMNSSRWASDISNPDRIVD